MGQFVEGLVERFLKDSRVRGYAPRTVESFRGTLRRFLAFLARRDIQELSDITAATLTAYQTSLMVERGPRGRPLTLGRQRQLVSEVQIFFRYLVKRGILLVDPTQRLELPRVPQRLPTRILDLSSMKQLLTAPDVKTPLGRRDRAVLELLYSTGLRVSELCGLDVFDIDLVEGELRVRRGKGGKSRVVPVGRAACNWVGRYLDDTRSLLARRPKETALFLTCRGRRMHRRDVSALLHLQVRRSGIKGRVTPHQIRHTFATHMLRGRASLRHLQELLGHARLTTTQIYTKVDITDLKAVHRRCHPRGRG